jgi:HEAT repeat protein
MNIPFVLLLLALASPPEQGTRPASETASAPSTAAWRGTEQLAKGWAALAAGRAGDAESVADVLLQGGVRRHDATTLKIHARVQAGRADGALDTYEQWAQTAAREDVFLLQPVARGLLYAQSKSSDAATRLRALEALAINGDTDAAARLEQMASAPNGGGTADETLARLGNAAAIGRLQERVTSPGMRTDVSAEIDALVKAKATSAAAAIAGALDPARPMPTKLAAARALGQLDARDALPQLRRALEDPDPPVRFMAAAALARMGDQAGAAQLTQMENSPVADIRMMAAEVAAPGNPSGAWVAAATAALQDPDPMARLGAADLLMRYAAEPTAGKAVLDHALADANPAMRLAAARTLDEIPPALLGTDIAQLRRLLRDTDAQIRIAAAGSLLRLTGGID